MTVTLRTATVRKRTDSATMIHVVGHTDEGCRFHGTITINEGQPESDLVYGNDYQGDEEELVAAIDDALVQQYPALVKAEMARICG